MGILLLHGATAQSQSDATRWFPGGVYRVKLLGEYGGEEGLIAFPGKRYSLRTGLSDGWITLTVSK